MAKFSSFLAAALMAAPLLTGCLAAGPGDAAARLPTPAYDPPATGASETAVLSGGCFWGVQGVFQHVRGVKNVLAGYAGGKRATAQYEVVSTGLTGHAESVKITFDPKTISYGEILRIFFSVATDPTQVNRQFPDEGDTIPVGNLLCRRGAEGGRPALYRPAQRRQGVQSADRHPGRSGHRLLQGRGLSSGLSRPTSGRPLYRHL